MARPIFSVGQLYHVYNRGVLKQPIFFDGRDYLRFIHDLYEFNDTRPAPKIGRPTSDDKREQIVSIVAWCLMPNHYHMLLKERREGGISLFLKKLGGGYTKFVNEKYDRSGHVFQGRFNAKLIEREEHYIHISRYIHLNPLALLESEWETGGIKNIQVAKDFLENFQWSSYRDWMGNTFFPSIIDLSVVGEIKKSTPEYQSFVLEWIPSDVQRRTSNVGT